MPLTSEQLDEYVIELTNHQENVRREREKRVDEYYRELGKEFERHPIAMHRAMGLR